MTISRSASLLLAALALAACGGDAPEDEPAPAAEGTAAAEPAPGAAPASPDSAPSLGDTLSARPGTYTSQVTGMDAPAPSGAARFCADAGEAPQFAIRLQDDLNGPGLTLVLTRSGPPQPGAHPVLDIEAYDSTSVFRATVLLDLGGETTPLVIGRGQLYLASVDSARVSGIFHIPVQESEMEVEEGQTPKSGTVSGSFHATPGGTCAELLAPPGA